MAQPISKKEIRRLPRIPYEKIRDSLQTGDVVFCRAVISSRALFKGLPTVYGAT